ncbi:hypothetical protein [Jiangella gansuensis]|uniref:hypothetical protein n=1 Tax=Jiangella gansuensis TaxID=281473 RepID=UPI00047A3856|nr:hypothetical protein [Jiangella gansuensis]
MAHPAGRLRFVPAPAADDARFAVGRVLLVVFVVIMTLHLASVTVQTQLRPDNRAVTDVLSLVNAGTERSLASWWTAALLALSGVAATTASWLARRLAGRNREARAWLLLAAVFALLSLDEAVSLHERGARWSVAVFDTDSLLARLGWTIPAAAALAASLLVLVPAFRAVPARPRRLIVAGLATAIAGALGMEVVHVLLTESGAGYLWRHLAMVTEEAAELAGVGIVLLGVLTAVRVGTAGSRLTLAYTDDDR